MKPPGWLPTKPSPHQLFMLAMFAKGWKFQLFNKKPGSWKTYWALRRRGLCNGCSSGNELTVKGLAVLAYYKDKGKDQK